MLLPRILTVYLFFVLAYSDAMAQNLHSHNEAYQVLGNRGEVYFTFRVDDHQLLNEFSAVISIDRYDPLTGYVYAYANQKGFESFIDYNVVYEILTAPSLTTEKSQINMLSSVDVANISSWDFYPTYPAYESMMLQFENLFPDLYESIELSTLPSGRKLIFGRITSNVNQEHEKPRFMYTSTMHGDETAGFNLMLRMIHYLLNNYGEDEAVTHLLDNLEIWICPNENPDGTYTTNNATISGATRGNANFVDLNRNYPNPITVPEPVIQPETNAMISLVQDYDYVMSSNMHGGIECVNYPWDSWTSGEKIHADHYWWQLVMHEYADTARYFSPAGYMDPWGPSFNNGVTHGGDWYVIYGSRQDYMNYYASLREFTLELSDIKLLPTSLLEDHWQYNYRSMLNYMQQSLYGIRGKVTDINTGEPVRAIIELAGHDKDNIFVYSSAEHGGFNRPVLEGTYTMRIQAEGYPMKTIQNISAQNYQTTWLDIQLGIYLSSPSFQLQTNQLIYPNPARDEVSVMGLPEAESIMIIDVSGRLLLEQQLSGSPTQFNISHLPAGIYLVRVFTREAVYQQKLIKK
ncbi:MAG: T9SS C-terminal target domain-containing protein [Bacteroidetes bacterium]|nr:MAG: T9SS C-terminal target domain-containing protein [Bacteroidota bacterium]